MSSLTEASRSSNYFLAKYAPTEMMVMIYFCSLAVEKDLEWTGLKFSPDGKTILVSTNGSLIRLIDAFTGATLRTFTGHLNSKNLPLEASFSPDSQFVISGNIEIIRIFMMKKTIRVYFFK